MDHLGGKVDHIGVRVMEVYFPPVDFAGVVQDSDINELVPVGDDSIILDWPV